MGELTFQDSPHLKGAFASFLSGGKINLNVNPYSYSSFKKQNERNKDKT